jgi:hypothetical protein
MANESGRLPYSDGDTASAERAALKPDASRLTSFVDAAFAFSLTLLVISFEGIPKNVDELVAAIKGIPAFLASFALIVRLWWIHHRFYERFALSDGRATVLSLVLVAVVLIFVYPLRIVFSAGFSFVTQGFIPWTFDIRSISELSILFIVYGAAWVSVSGVLGLLHLHAWHSRLQLNLDGQRCLELKLDCLSYASMALVGLLSITIAVLTPAQASSWQLSFPGWVYFLMFLVAPLSQWLARRWQPSKD